MRNNRKILIVDDEIDLCLLLKDYFTRRNYEVIVAHTFEDGKYMLATHRPDILIVDNNLTDGIGWNLAPGAAAEIPGIFVLLTSAFHPAAPAMPQGSHYLIMEKPIRIAELDGVFSRAQAG